MASKSGRIVTLLMNIEQRYLHAGLTRLWSGLRFIAHGALLVAICTPSVEADSKVAVDESFKAHSLQQVIELLEKSDRQLIEHTLQLAEEKAQRFWPLYEEYQARMGRLADKGRTILTIYGNKYPDQVDELFSKQVLDSIFEIEQQSLRIREYYYGQFGLVLSQTELLRLHQQEMRVKNLRSVQIQNLIPLIR